MERESDLPGRDPEVRSPRGLISYRNLLASQRWHVAFHYRQLLAFLAERGHDLGEVLALASLADLELPPEVF